MSQIPDVNKSKRLFERAKKSIPGGSCSENRSPNRGLTPGIYPLYMEKGKGSKIYDVDGNEYIDYLLGVGPIILGHSHPKVNEAVKEQIDKGTILGVNNELDIEVAEKTPVIEKTPVAKKPAKRKTKKTVKK